MYLDKMNSIVYITTNKINGKKYIGSTTESRKDFSTYLGSGRLLKYAIKKYGKENFIRQILWEGPSNFKYEMEDYYIDYYNASKSDLFYNIADKGVGASVGQTHNNQTKNKIGKSNSKPKPEGFAELMSELHKGKSTTLGKTWKWKAERKTRSDKGMSKDLSSKIGMKYKNNNIQ